MPKVIITDSTIPIALHELDKWSGKLTWELYAERLASVLGEKRISRYTLLSYPVLADAFKQKKNLLRAAPQSSAVEVQDVTLGHLEKPRFPKIRPIKIRDLRSQFCRNQGFFEAPFGVC